MHYEKAAKEIGDVSMNSFLRLLLLRSLWLFLEALATNTLAAGWTEMDLYNLQGATGGSTPVGRLVFDKAGNIYGVTLNGGSSSCISLAQCGTVFKLLRPQVPGDPWTERVLYVFKGNAADDGATPDGGLVMDGAGNLYGTTSYGGTG